MIMIVGRQDLAYAHRLTDFKDVKLEHLPKVFHESAERSNVVLYLHQDHIKVMKHRFEPVVGNVFGIKDLARLVESGMYPINILAGSQ